MPARARRSSALARHGAEFYPFGEDMVDTIAQWSTESPERSSPRQIMAVLAKAIATA